PLSDAGLTPYHAIKRALPRLRPGTHAVVIGIGGLGHMAVQILGALCATRVVAVDTSPERLAMARELGAQAAIHAGPDAAAEVREATGGGADLVLDMVGSTSSLETGAKVLRSEG